MAQNMLRRGSMILNSFRTKANEESNKQKEALKRFEQKYVVSNNKLGKGGFGSVYLGERREDNKVVAVKMVEKENLTATDLKRTLGEVKILKQLNHRNIVRVYESFDCPDHVCIVMERIVGCDLIGYMRKNSIDENEARFIIHDLTCAAKFCHQNNIVHRDIKPGNVLIEEREKGRRTVKLIDFNLSKTLTSDTIDWDIMETRCGTKAYVAPEVLNKSPGYSYKCDIFSIGVLAYYLLSEEVPFSSYEAKLMQRDNIDWYPSARFEEVSKDGIDFIENCLRKNPDRRMSYEQMLQHPWIHKVVPVDNKIKQNKSQAEFDAMKKFVTAAVVLHSAKRLLKSKDKQIKIPRVYDSSTAMLVEESGFFF